MSSKINFCKAMYLCCLIPLIFAMVLALTGCGSIKTEKVKYLVGVAHADLSEDWQVSLDQEMRNQVNASGDIELITTNANGSTYKQVKDLQTLLDYDVDIMIVTPNDNTVMKREIEKVYQQIPVIVMNRELSGMDYTMYIGPDFYDIGQVIGEEVERYAKDDMTNVIELKGPFNDRSVESMIYGFHNVVAKSKNIKLYAEFAADWKRDDAMDWYQVNHKFYSDGDVVVSHNQAMAKGIRDSEEVLNEDRLTLFAAEAIGNDEAHIRNAFKNGFEHISKWQLGGTEAITYALEILKGNGDVPKRVILNNYNVNRDNVETYLSYEESFKAKPLNKLGLIESGIGSWDRAQANSLKRAAQSNDIELSEVIINVNAGLAQQQKEQIEALNTLIDGGVDAIVLSPVVSDGWDKAFETAHRKEVPVIVINNPIVQRANRQNLFIGYDGKHEGELIGRWLVENLYGETDIHLSIVGGDPESLAHTQRMKGINDVINDYSRISIVNDWTKDESLSMAINQVMYHTKEAMKVVLVLDENTVDEAEKSVKSLNASPGTDIKLLCFGDPSSYTGKTVDQEILCMVGRSPDIGTLIIESVQKKFNSPYSPKGIFNYNDVLSN